MKILSEVLFVIGLILYILGVSTSINSVLSGTPPVSNMDTVAFFMLTIATFIASITAKYLSKK